MERLVKYISLCISGIMAFVNREIGMIGYFLVALMAFDLILGSYKACLKNGYRSRRFFEGFTRKILIVCMVLICLLFDMAIGFQVNIFTSMAIFGYCKYELSSIIENLGECDIVVPSVFYQILEVLKEKEDNNPKKDNQNQ